MISEKPNVSLGILDYSLYTRRIAIKDDYHNKRTDMLAYNFAEFNYLETFAKTFVTAATKKQCNQKKFQQWSSSSDF